MSPIRPWRWRKTHNQLDSQRLELLESLSLDLDTALTACRCLGPGGSPGHPEQVDALIEQHPDYWLFVCRWRAPGSVCC